MPAGKYERSPELKKHLSKLNTKEKIYKMSKKERDAKRVASLKAGCKPPTGYGKENPNWKGGLPHCLNCGKKLSQRHYKRCKSCARKGNRNPHYNCKGELASNWRGGDTHFYKDIRNLFEYRQWKSDVLHRDEHCCVECRIKNVDLHAHHIKPMHKILKNNGIKSVEEALVCNELWDINNGKTLCVPCHHKEHNWSGSRYFKEQGDKKCHNPT